ncbi:hypothetical protein K6119_04365 [Paracrocinitomix mangrovi]|uniref:hypothetical protein n=1 Tax=Paracrocinitomix mangrovi TaxID=2862509 RepID=UPI001C8D34C6|nr:hypothetical protein [Paracrocinitomix mangrovi]UKN02748.1 hypothetical protein K6119_04365 [Paracrocinitomix mangrovi]
MKHLFILILLLSFNTLFSQEHSYLFEKSVIKENRVYKIVEYDPEDSVKFFEQYLNGYYSLYDTFGRMVESNFYVPNYLDTAWIPFETKNYFMYDSLDNKIGFIQMDQFPSPSFRKIELKSYGYNSDSVKKVALESPWETHSNFIFTEYSLNEEQKHMATDTFKINDYHKSVSYFNDSTRFADIFYNQYGLIDSIIRHDICIGAPGRHICQTRIVNTYDSKGNLVKRVVQLYQLIREKKLYSEIEYYYLQSGLLDYITTYFTSTQEKQTSKFKYYYRTI